MSYSEAPQRVLDLVQEVINEHHPHLKPFNIAVIMKDKASMSRGKVIMGTAAKFPEKLKPLMEQEYHFLITLADDAWQGLNPAQKRALVDHELLHCEVDGNLEPTLRGHDFEVFAEEIERHGFWKSDLRVMASAVQGRLELGDSYVGVVGTLRQLQDMGAVLEAA